MGEAATGDRFDLMESVTRVGLSVINSFNPIGGGTVLQTIAPTILDPIAMMGENKTFMNTPLKPEHTYDSRLPAPEYTMHWSSSRQASNAIAQWLNDASGGNAVRPGAINVSPEWIDLVYDTLTGGAGKTAANAMDMVNRLATGEDMAVENIPFVRRVTGYNSEYGVKTRYYEWSKGVGYAKSEAKNLKGYELTEAKTNPEYQMIPAFKAAEKQLAGMRKLRNEMEKRGASKDKIEAIDAKMRAVMAKFNEKYADRVLED
jgi:hypothetical protein